MNWTHESELNFEKVWGRSTREREKEEGRIHWGDVTENLSEVLLESDVISLGLRRMCGFFLGLWVPTARASRSCPSLAAWALAGTPWGTRVDLRARFDATEGQFPVGAFYYCYYWGFCVNY